MNVIPSGTNFNFLLWPLLKILAIMLVITLGLGYVYKSMFSRLPKAVYNFGFNVILAFGVLAGIYFGVKLFA